DIRNHADRRTSGAGFGEVEDARKVVPENYGGKEGRRYRSERVVQVFCSGGTRSCCGLAELAALDRHHGHEFTYPATRAAGAGRTVRMLGCAAGMAESSVRLYSCVGSANSVAASLHSMISPRFITAMRSAMTRTSDMSCEMNRYARLRSDCSSRRRLMT